MCSFLLIRIVELNNLEVLLTNKRILALFLGVFLPLQLALLITGFKWFFEAAKSRCMQKDKKSDGDDSLVYFMVLILTMLRCFMLFMLASIVFSARYRREQQRALPLRQPLQHNNEAAGLTSEQLEHLVRVKVDKRNQAEYCSDACSICLNDFRVKDKLIVLACEHPFHEECISKWLSQAKECPNCKRDTTIIQDEDIVYDISS